MPVDDRFGTGLALLGGRPVAPKGALPKDRPQVSSDDLSAVASVVASGEWSMFTSRDIEAFENEFAACIGSEHAILVNSCTTALYVTLLALDLPSNPRIAVPAYTYIGTCTPVLAVGGTPVFVDVDESTLSMDVDALEYVLDSRSPVHAVIVPHLFGVAGDVQRMAVLCAANGVALIHDCAQFLGDNAATEEIVATGPCCFSFGESKLLRMGEGGAVATNSAALLERIRLARHQGEVWLNAGRSRSAGGYRVAEDPLVGLVAMHPGMNFRPTAFIAALGRARLRGLDLEMNARRNNAEILLSALRGSTCLEPLTERPNTWWTFPVLIRRDDLARDVLLAALIAEGIPVGVHFPRTMPEHPIFAAFGDVAVHQKALHFAARHLVLPIYPALTVEHIELVIDSIAKIDLHLDRLTRPDMVIAARDYLASARLTELCQGIFFFTA